MIAPNQIAVVTAMFGGALQPTQGIVFVAGLEFLGVVDEAFDTCGLLQSLAHKGPLLSQRPFDQ